MSTSAFRCVATRYASVVLATLFCCAAAFAAEPDYSEWNRLLSTYYSPASGMDYAHLKASDGPALDRLRKALGHINVQALTPKEQLAYWINVYNINIVSTIVEHYPVKSIRDISTDPIIRLNVFKKETVPVASGMTSLKSIEDDKIRAGFHDPRIHFAINCAAHSCPPIRTEAYTGAHLDAQLDDQVRKFLAGPGVRVELHGNQSVVHTTKIMDWFGEDFDKWGGGKVAFLKRYLPAAKASQLGGSAKIEYDDYDWSLNDRKR